MKNYLSPAMKIDTLLPDVILVSDLELNMSGQYEDEEENEEE